MEFLLNNPVILFVVLAVVGLVIMTVRQIVNEVTLNRDLKLKQKTLRVKTPGNPFGKRMGLLGARALVPVSILVIAFVVGANLESTPNTDFNIVASSDDVISLFEDFQSRMETSYHRFGGINPTVDFMEDTPEAAMDMDDTSNEGTGSDDYSGTNNQVVGVDEMDNVITDGKYIYALYGHELTITLAYTMEDGIDVLDLVKTIEYESDYCSGEQFYPMGLYVDGDRLIVVGNKYSYNCEPVDGEGKDELYYYDYYYGNSSEVSVLVYDKETFELEDEYEFNGYFTGTRKIEDTLYMVVNKYIPFYLEEQDDEFSIDRFLPYYSVNGSVTEATYESIYYVDGTNPNAFTTFYAIDLEEKEVDMEVVLGNNGFNLYVSNNNIYLVGGVYYFWPLAELIDVEDPVQEYKTAILRVSIDDSDLTVNGVGYVDGYTLNQFSMDEYDGKLRIATTEGWWGEEINNRVFVLDENLEVMSVIENLGKPGETIRSVRFTGEYGYVVTFLQTDPFYVINLSDPANPVVEGELEIPGFSTYLQPMGENYMLGIGFDADDEGRVQGLKIAVYDISDKANPIEFDNIIFSYEDFGWSHSSATYNHKDLLVSLSKGIIALPFSTYTWDPEGSTYSSGILVYNFDEELGLSFNGFVQHEENADWNIYVYKSKFISDYFYTVSNKYIKVSPINDVENILDEVQLRDVESHYYYGTDEVVD